MTIYMKGYTLLIDECYYNDNKETSSNIITKQSSSFINSVAVCLAINTDNTAQVIMDNDNYGCR